MTDWLGNDKSVYVTLGIHGNEKRQTDDYYATEPKALELLLDIERFNKNVWECACGEGHLSKVLIDRGYNCKSTDLIYRGFGIGGVDFLKQNEKWDGDIITNPPYRYALEFIKHALEISDGKVAMFLKLQFLEGRKRKEFFAQHPPKVIYVASSRLACAKNGNFDKYAGKNAVAYAWFIWEKGSKTEPVIRWFN